MQETEEQERLTVPLGEEVKADLRKKSRQLCGPVAYGYGDDIEPTENPEFCITDPFRFTIAEIVEYACRTWVDRYDDDFHTMRTEEHPFIPHLAIKTTYELDIVDEGRQISIKSEICDNIIIVDRLFRKEEIEQQSSDWPEEERTRTQEIILHWLSVRSKLGKIHHTHLAVVGCGNFERGNRTYFSDCAHIGVNCEKTNLVVLSSETGEVLCPTATRDRLAVLPGSWNQRKVGELFVPGFK
jgi:hypothetical protein